jgi:hypothetical protein
MGYKEIKQGKNYFLGLYESPISSDWHGFITFQEKLSGNIDLNKIVEYINNVRSESSFHTTFIVSQYHISNGFRENINLKYET